MSKQMTGLTAEQQALLALLSAGIHGKPVVLPPEADWQQVVDESLRQTVSMLALEGSGTAGIALPEPVLDSWLQISLEYISWNMQHAAQQKELTQLLEKNGLDYVILKGAASAAYYPKPEQRAYGDVDFLIDPAQQPEVERLLIEKGYRRWKMDHICHVVFHKGNIAVEMHFEPAGIPAGRPGQLVREYLQGAAGRYGVCAQEGNSFHGPLPRDHALILLLHMQHHMLSEGIGLRHLCDWACFVNATAAESFWDEDVLPLLRRIGLLTFAGVMTRTCSLYLHTPCPAWAEEADQSLCLAVMQDILAGGNFGRKDPQRAASGALISRHGKEGTRHGYLYNLLCTMHETVMAHHPVIRRMPVLYPVFYGYRVLRFGWLRLTGQRESLLGRIGYANQRKAIYDRLHVFEPEQEEIA